MTHFPGPGERHPLEHTKFDLPDITAPVAKKEVERAIADANRSALSEPEDDDEDRTGASGRPGDRPKSESHGRSDGDRNGRSGSDPKSDNQRTTKSDNDRSGKSASDRHAKSDDRHAKSDDRHAKSDDRHAKSDDRHAKSDDRHAKSDDRHANTNGDRNSNSSGDRNAKSEAERQAVERSSDRAKSEVDRAGSSERGKSDRSSPANLGKAPVGNTRHERQQPPRPVSSPVPWPEPAASARPAQARPSKPPVVDDDEESSVFDDSLPEPSGIAEPTLIFPEDDDGEDTQLDDPLKRRKK